MRERLLLIVVSSFFLFARTASAPKPPTPGVDWPQFRGIAAQGIAEGFATPLDWDLGSKKNIRWRVPLPGLGLSSPVIWGNLLCLTSAQSGRTDASIKSGYYGDITPVTDDTVHQWRISCLDKRTGAKVWEQTAHSGVPKIKRHMKSTHANSTLATDGEHLVAFFGSEGLYVYDLKGKLLWKKDLGVLDAGYYVVPEAQWETGSSPVIHDGAVLHDNARAGDLPLDPRGGQQLHAAQRGDRPRDGAADRDGLAADRRRHLRALPDREAALGVERAVKLPVDLEVDRIFERQRPRHARVHLEPLLRLVLVRSVPP